MANCYNCIHIEVCDISIKLETHDKPKMLDHKCVYFKDKEKIVELPDKVYDIRLSKTGMKVDEHEVKGIIFDCEYMAFDSKAIGKRIFLTQEEAGKALAERQVDNE